MGKIKGGKETYKILVKKYGYKEIRRRQIKGGKISLLRRNEQAKKNFRLDVNDPLFLEFYGALLGDGWLSSLSYTYKTKRNLWWVGISGHSILDKDYLMFLKSVIKKLFNKNAITKYKKNKNGMEILFCHKQLILFMNNKLRFPIGKKIGLRIYENFLDWDKAKYILRGLFDTDGCFYLDKTPARRPYPCIFISMKSPFLIKQLYDILIDRGFKVTYRIRKDGMHKIVLEGSIQLSKWIEEIGSSNPKHFNKINKFLLMSPSSSVGLERCPPKA